MQRRKKLNAENEKVSILNQLTKIIDGQAAKFKAERKTMPDSRFYNEKKLLLENIGNAIELTNQIKSLPNKKEMLSDFQRLHKEISGLKVAR